jgi:hypothetical protein
VIGNILCDLCMELRKNSLLSRKDVEINSLTEKSKELEKEAQTLRLQLQDSIYENESLIEKLGNSSKQSSDLEDKYKKLKNIDTEYLEKENTRLHDSIDVLNRTIDNLVKEKNKYEMVYSQMILDNEKLSIDVERLKGLNGMLNDHNNFLERENNIYNILNKELTDQLYSLKKNISV